VANENNISRKVFDHRTSDPYNQPNGVCRDTIGSDLDRCIRMINKSGALDQRLCVWSDLWFFRAREVWLARV